MKGIIKKNVMGFQTQEIMQDIIRLGYSEQWVAEQMKVSQGCVNRIKKGQTQLPRVDTYYKLIQLHQKCFPVDH